MHLPVIISSPSQLQLEYFYIASTQDWHKWGLIWFRRFLILHFVAQDKTEVTIIKEAIREDSRLIAAQESTFSS